MIKHIVNAGLIVAVLGGMSGAAIGKPPVFRAVATWTVNPPEPCGAFSTVQVRSTQADVDVIELTYQFGNTCDNSFHIVQATGAGTIDGNLNHLRIVATIATSDERPVDVDLTLKKTKDLSDKGPGEKTVSARATGTVILDGVDLTGGVPTNDATITRSKS